MTPEPKEVVLRLTEEEANAALAALVTANGIGRSSAFPPAQPWLDVEAKLRLASQDTAAEGERRRWTLYPRSVVAGPELVDDESVEVEEVR